MLQFWNSALVISWVYLLLWQARRSYIKLDIYRKFTNALAVAIIASVAWIGYEVYISFLFEEVLVYPHSMS